MINPIIAEAIAVSKTAPAAVSLAILALGLI